MSSKALADSVDVGTVVANTYEVISILGRGGMGTVWEAHHKRLPGKRVAIKVLHPSVAEDADALARFRREAEIACRLGHPNIVEVHDFNFLEDGTPYLVLELLEGQSLDAKLREGALGLTLCEEILRQVSSALQSAHEQGVIHRDLKPQNIFLVPSPSGVGPDIAKVLDFGISKIKGSQTVKTQESTLLGTPQYMAPEQATGQHDNVDARTDLFALAVMLYELLSGRAAFSGKSIPEVVYKVVHVDATPITKYLPELPAEKAAALSRAMSKAQDDRYDSVAAFVEAFTGVPLAESRPRLTPVPSDLAESSTLDSNKISLGSAATMDSQKVSNRATNLADLASAATVDSGKLARDQAFAETIDSSKMDRESTQMPAQPALPLSTQAGESAAPRSVTVRTLFIAIALIGCAVGVAWIFVGGSSQDAQETKSARHQQGTKTRGATVKAPVATATLDASVRVVAKGEEAIDTQVLPVDPASQGDADVGDSEIDIDQTSANLEKGQAGAKLDAAVEESSSAGSASKSATPRRSPPRVPRVAPPTETSGVNAAKAKKMLTRAKALLKDGRNDDAIALAMRAYVLHKLPESFAIKVKASCRKSDHSNANGAIRNIPRKRKKLRKGLESYCLKRGIKLDMRL